MKWPGFCGPSNVTQSSLADCERTVNFYLENVESDFGTAKAAMYSRPGVLTIDAAPSGGGRAHIFTSGREFVIIATKLYEVPELLTPSIDGPSTSQLIDRGTVASDQNPATMQGNGDAGDQIFITSGGNGYIYDLVADTLTAVAALAGKATMGGYLDGYFLALDATTSTLWISDLLDGTTWDPTQFIVRVGASDPWVSMIVNQYIYLLGSQTSEVWFDAGAFPIPFELHPSGRLQYGCGAPFSPEVVGTSVVWVGQTVNGNGTVLRTPGFSIEIISNFSTQYAFGQLVDLVDAIGDSFEMLGHTFYTLSFRAAEKTWVWDAATNAWVEWSTWNASNNEFEALRPIFHAFAFGKHRVLDLKGPRIYEMSETYGYDVEGMPLRRMRRPPVLMNENKRVFFRKIELFAEAGLGNTSGDGEDPQVSMRWTNDGGKLWGAYISRSMGRIGEYFKRMIWLRLGAGRKRTFEFVCSEPTPVRFLDAFVEITPGNN
jgi:hypothetical protein